MKKTLRFKRKKAQAPETPNRITNETVAEHREKILAGGRRFKYPVQYAKHRLVINTIVISVVAVLLVVFVVWWQLYTVQNTSTFFYRITRVIPLPVASVEGQQVPYSSYLQRLRSQEHYLQTKEGVNLYSKENKDRLEWYRRQSLDNAVADAYAAKLAKEKGITVSDQEIDQNIRSQRGSTSEEAYYAIVLDHFGWTRDELREDTARALLRHKVAYSVDDTASQLKQQVETALAKTHDFEKIAASIAPIDGVKVESSVTPLVPTSNQDGGLAEAASKLSAAGQVSPVFQSSTGDGYYVVKLLEKQDSRVSYAVLRIPLTVFQKQLDAVRSGDKVEEYITIAAVKSPTPAQ